MCNLGVDPQLPKRCILKPIGEDSEACTRQTAQSGQTGMQKLARRIGTIQSSYTQAINKQETRTGSLFQPKSKAKQLETVEQAFNCFNYIHQNPLKAGLVAKMEDWKFSSFNEYYSGETGLCNRDRATRLLDLPTEHTLFYEQSYAVIQPSE